MVELGSTLRSLRTENNLTQQELAERSGVANTIISRIENNIIQDPRLSTLTRLATGLDLSVSELFRNIEIDPGKRKEILSSLRDHRDELRDRFHVDEIGVFGSVARGESMPESDIDILVRYEGGHRDIFNHSRLEGYLEDLLDGPVDLVMNPDDATDGHGRIRENIDEDLIRA